MNTVFDRLARLVVELEKACDDAKALCVDVCLHEFYETLSDPTSHRCTACGSYLATDAADGTGNVLVPHRPWQPLESQTRKVGES